MHKCKKSSTFARKFQLMNKMKKSILIVLMAAMSVAGMAQHHPEYHGDRGHGHGGHHYIECATHEQMQMTLKVMGDQSFDDKKLEIAKLCVTLGRFCTDDLARMAALFSFDDNRLKFLQYAYPYCQDPQNYYSLRESFSFKSNFDTMMESLHPGYKR